MKRWPGFAPLVLLLLLVVTTSIARAETALQPTRPELTARDIEDSLGSDWYGVYLEDIKVGWANVETGKTTVGDAAVFRETVAIEIKAAPADVKLTQTLDYDLAPPYRLRHGEFAERGGDVLTTRTVRATPTGYEAVIVSGAAVRKRGLPGLDYTLADALSMDVWLRRGTPKTGESIAWRTIDSESLEVKLETGTLLATKTSVVGGVAVVFHEVRAIGYSKQEILLRYDASRRRFIAATLSGTELELRLETEAQAKDTSYAADPFVLGMVRLDRPLGSPDRIVALILEARGPDVGRHLVPGPHQHVEAKADGSLVVKLGGKYAVPVPATEAEVDAALLETLKYPIDEPQVKALARQAVGDAKTPHEKVARLLQFTHNYIRPQIDAVGPQLLDLLDRKAGDCKSYALLFNTLARAAGVPAREVAGLAYMGDDVMAFGGHAWNEVVLDGMWVPVDATAPDLPMREVHLRGGLSDVFTRFPRTSLRVLTVETRE